MKDARDPLLSHVRGAALLLVVFGHALGGDPAIASWVPPSLWTASVGAWIYSFHMPLFMFCAGWAQSLSRPRGAVLEAWQPFLLRRGRRLLVPFFFAALLIHGPASALVSPQCGWLETSVRLLLGLGGGHLWFLWTLFAIQVVTRALDPLRLPWPALASIALVSSVGSLAREHLGWSDLLEWNSILRFLPWYLLGFIGPVSTRWIADRSRGQASRLLGLAVCGWSIHAGFWLLASSIPDRGNPVLTSLAHFAREWTAFAGITASIATMALINAIAPCRTRWIEALDRRGMEIYLLHGPIQWGLARLWAGLALSAPSYPFAAFALGIAGALGLAWIHAAYPVSSALRSLVASIGGASRHTGKESP